MSHLDVKQVIVVRTKFPDGKGGTFGMRTGKLAAQVAHASLQVFVNFSKNQPVPCDDIQTGRSSR